MDNCKKQPNIDLTASSDGGKNNGLDLIRRRDAIDAMIRLQAEDIEAYGCEIPEGFDGDRAVTALKELPSAEPEQKTGKWAYKITNYYIQRTCNTCGWSERIYHRNRIQDGSIRNYCPNCGAKNGGEG